MITVYCDKGHKPWTVARFTLRRGEGWQQVEASSNALKLEHRRHSTANPGPVRNIEDFLAAPRFADKPLNSREVVDGEETGQPLASPPAGYVGSLTDPTEDRHVTYTLKCGPCQRKRRHSTFTRREDKLWPILARLRGNGIDRITLDGMARAAGLIDTEGRTAESE